MKGQVFVAAAIAFSALIVGASLTTGPRFLGSSTSSTQNYFKQTLEETQEAFNAALEENASVDRAKHGVYSYDRFVERRSLAKGIQFKAYHLLAVPEEGKAVFINYFDRSLTIELKAGGSPWTNTTVAPNSSVEESFEAGTTRFSLNVDETGTSHEFDAATPKALTYSRMESSGETWTNTVLG